MKSEHDPLRGLGQFLRGETILITGASSGLGADFAAMLGRAGAKVALAARRREKLAQLESELKSQGIVACSVEMDVACAQSVASGFEQASTNLGPITGAVANAGMNVEGAVLKLEERDIDALLAVNIKGVLLTAREAARQIIASADHRVHNGKIVLVSSITAGHVSKGIALYSASKAAVQQLGRCLASDWADKGINVNVLSPGFVETSLNSDWFNTKLGQKQINAWPRERLMSANDLGGALSFLLSPLSEKTTGSVFTVDDGQTFS